MWLRVILLFAGLLGEAQMQLPNGILEAIRAEVAYESLLVLHNASESCGLQLDLCSKTPIINFDLDQYHQLKHRFNRRILAVICVHKLHVYTLNGLFENLQDMRETPAVFLTSPGVNLDELFRSCLNKKMLNVLAFDGSTPEFVYSYRAFPSFRLVKRHIAGVRRFFEPQLRDLGGFPIMSLPENTLPRSVVYVDKDGKPQSTGYLMEFLRNFAKTLNASLEMRWQYVPLHPPETIVPWTTLKHLIYKDVVDIPLVIVNIMSSQKSKLVFTHIMEMSKYQLMLPSEPEVNRNLLIFTAGNPLHFLLTFCAMCLLALLLHNARRLELGKGPSAWGLFGSIDTVLRAVLCQTFVCPGRPPSTRLMNIYQLLLLFSFLSYNIYLSQLEMLMVHPATEPAVRNYQDLRKRGLKILVTTDEIIVMKIVLDDKILENFWDYHKETNTSEYQAMRRQPNSSYAYPITQTLWPLIERKLMKQPYPSFRLSNDFVFFFMVPFAIPLPRNSIFKDALNRFILNAQCSGLYNLWFRQSFTCLVAIGRMEILPYDGSKDNMHLRWRDLLYIWYLYALLVAVASIVFALELLIHRRSQVLG
ncbi:hypothetical protein KR222_007235 [Zaprionus bogoriensis]|nr:hypothetical protein KR222_007235 [Zaprionus bogoriensis]